MAAIWSWVCWGIAGFIIFGYGTFTILRLRSGIKKPKKGVTK